MSDISNLTSGYDAFEEDRGSQDPDWLKALRSTALSQSESLGLPSTRQEDWRYTDLSRLSKEDYVHAPTAASVSAVPALPFELSTTLNFLNGRFSSRTGENLPAGALITNLQDAIAQNEALIQKHLAQIAAPGFHGLTALNTAYIADAAVIYLPANVEVEHPVRLVFETRTSEALATYPRIIVIAESGSQVTIIEEYLGDDDTTYLNNSVAEFSIGPGARIHHYVWNQAGDQSVHIGTTQARIERDGSFHSHNLCLGGDLVRNDLNIRFAGPGGETSMHCLYISSETQHIDNHTRVDHAQPHCTSYQLYKGILGGRSHGVFNGKVVVHKDAQKTSAEQNNHNILLTEHAAIDTKPELEIYADDVRCGHGSTVGQLDEDAIFFLRTRGIPHTEAQKLLTHAFAHSVLEAIEHEGIAAHARDLVNRKLETLAISEP